MKDFATFTIKENDSNRRLDRIARKMLFNLPLSSVYSAIRNGKILVNNKKVKGNTVVLLNDVLKIETSLLPTKSSIHTAMNKSPDHLKITPFKNTILYKDFDFLVLAKKANEIVHGKNSLDEKVKAYSKTNSLSFTAGALHRLDYGTSGILVFSQSLKGAQEFSKALQEGAINRKYLALVEGCFYGEKMVKTAVEGKQAKTLIREVKVFTEQNTSLVEVKIFTGRKHQIRIHCAEINFPLVGDALAKKKSNIQNGGAKLENYFLHFYKMETHTKILNLPQVITCPLPQSFNDILLQNNYSCTNFLTI